MYIRGLFKILALSFILTFNISPKNFAHSAPDSDILHEGVEGFITRFKKALNTFTDCGVDSLIKNCNEHTAKNFECFRCLGDCISKAARHLIKPGEEDDEPEPEPTANDEL